MWFDSWYDVVRVILVGAAAYVTLVAVLRISGKRTLAKLNAFDLIVTVALGSTLATILLNSSVSWSEGLVAIAVLTSLQYIVALIGSRIPSARSLVTAQPTLLVHDGAVLDEVLQGERVAVAEVRQALRASGHGDLSQVAAVVLETDGTLSVIASGNRGNAWALADVS
ncbi:MAG TPA: YetF domain-containing protein [Jiangellaceae bacterium]